MIHYNKKGWHHVASDNPTICDARCMLIMKKRLIICCCFLIKIQDWNFKKDRSLEIGLFVVIICPHSTTLMICDHPRLPSIRKRTWDLELHSIFDGSLLDWYLISYQLTDVMCKEEGEIQFQVQTENLGSGTFDTLGTVSTFYCRDIESTLPT